MPLLAQNAVKFHPDRRPAQMFGVGNQRVPVEPLGEQSLAQRDGFFLLHLVDSRLQPVFFRRFHDERGPILVEAIGVEIEPAPLRFAEIESEGVELFPAAQPDEAVVPDLNIGLEYGFIGFAGDGGGAVRSDHQIIFRRIFFGVGDFRFKNELHSQARRSLLQDVAAASCARCRKIRARRM